MSEGDTYPYTEVRGNDGGQKGTVRGELVRGIRETKRSVIAEVKEVSKENRKV